jgi:hypothetical protein
MWDLSININLTQIDNITYSSNEWHRLYMIVCIVFWWRHFCWGGGGGGRHMQNSASLFIGNVHPVRQWPFLLGLNMLVSIFHEVNKNLGKNKIKWNYCLLLISDEDKGETKNKEAPHPRWPIAKTPKGPVPRIAGSAALCQGSAHPVRQWPFCWVTTGLILDSIQSTKT